MSEQITEIEEVSEPVAAPEAESVVVADVAGVPAVSENAAPLDIPASDGGDAPVAEPARRMNMAELDKRYVRMPLSLLEVP